MTGDDLLQRLPHRPPFLFLTSVVRLETDSAEAVWRVEGGEWFLAGHFPGRPIVPGVLQTEALAQLAGLVAMSAINTGTGGERPGAPGEGKLAHIDVRFYEPAAPPVEIVLHARLERQFGKLYQFEVRATAAGRRLCAGGLTLAIEPPTSAGAGA